MVQYIYLNEYNVRAEGNVYLQFDAIKQMRVVGLPVFTDAIQEHKKYKELTQITGLGIFSLRYATGTGDGNGMKVVETPEEILELIKKAENAEKSGKSDVMSGDCVTIRLENHE